jgi:single-strand DNA-binding protein
VRSFQNGGKVCNLRIATSETWKDRNSGERQERTEWHSVDLLRRSGGVAERFLRKGSKVYIEGQLRTRKWQDQSGNDRYSTEVVLQGPGAVLTMLDGAPGAGGGSGGRRLRRRPALGRRRRRLERGGSGGSSRGGGSSSGGGWNQGGGGSSAAASPTIWRRRISRSDLHEPPRLPGRFRYVPRVSP